MKIALCDDERFHSTVLKRVIHEWSKDQKETIDIYVYESAEEFLTDFDKGARFDLAFLDIQMGGMNGVELAKLIRDRDMNMIIVFITSFMDYVLLGYEVDAYRFLVKPVTDKKVLETLQAAIEIHKRRHTGSYTITIGLSTFSVNKTEVVFFTTDYHYLNIHTFTDTYKIRGKLTELAEEFAKPMFVKCNRGVLINVEHISCIHRDMVIMTTKDKLSIGRTYWDDLNQCYLAIHAEPLVQSIRSSLKREAT